MLRNITLAVAGIAAAGILAAPAQASPAFCAPHDAGTVYIHACAKGGGGGDGGAAGARYMMKRLGITQADLDAVRAQHQNH
jgi:hypothetical protein